MKKFVRSSLVAVLVLVGSFVGYQIVQALGGEGTATIDGAANVTVVQSTSHKFTVVLTIGTNGITANALNPTFTIPAGFTAPNGTPVLNAGSVVADGNWSVTSAGGTCTVDEDNSENLTVAVGQLITVDVNGTCATGHTPPDTITLTYQGQSSIAMAATALVIKTGVAIDQNPLLAIAAPPTITVTAASSGGLRTGTINVVKHVINDNGRTKIVADFPLFVNGTLVVSGVTNTFPAPAVAYIVTETGDPNYTRTFSGDCDVNGQVGLSPGDNKFCIVTNNDIGAPTVVPPVPPLIDVVKVPSPLALPGGPGPVTYTYTLTNIGTVPVTDVTMVGDSCSPIVRVSGDTNGDSKLDVNETWVYTCTTTLSATHTNIVTTTGWANGISTIDLATATVVVGAAIVPPLIHMTKSPNVYSLPVGGGAVIYTYVVTNPGTATLSDVRITSDKCTGVPSRVLGNPGDINKNDLLESSETWLFTCLSNITQTTTSTGTAWGSANGLTARDLAVDTVTVGALPSTPTPISLGFTNLAALSLREGDTVSAAGSSDPDTYITNAWGYKRLFLNPAIFSFYGHLGGFASVKTISPLTRAMLVTSGLFRNCETNDPKVYGVEVTGEDMGTLHWINISGAQAVAEDTNFFKKVFCINNNEFNWYSKGSNYTSLSQVPMYSR